MADILLVDDDEDLASALGDILRADGHVVRIARNGFEGLLALDGGLPDLVVLDVEMPVLDGPSMAYEMFVHDMGKEKLPVLLVSGVPDLAALAQRVGTPYFLPKPCGLDDFAALLSRALRERKPPVPGSR